MTGAPMPESLRPRRERNPEHALQCSGCRAAPGRPCTTPKGRPLAAGSHPSRLDEWIAARVNAATRPEETQL